MSFGVGSLIASCTEKEVTIVKLADKSTLPFHLIKEDARLAVSCFEPLFGKPQLKLSCLFIQFENTVLRVQKRLNLLIRSLSMHEAVLFWLFLEAFKIIDLNATDDEFIFRKQ